MCKWIGLTLWVTIALFGIMLTAVAPRSWQCHDDNPVITMSFAPKNATIRVLRPDALEFWTPDGNDLERVFRLAFDREQGVSDIVFAPDDSTFLTSHAKTPVASLWDTKTGVRLHTLVGHRNHVSRMVYAPDGRTILTGSDDGTAILWDARTGALLHRLQGHTAGLRSVAFSPDSKAVLTGDYANTAILWDAQTGAQRHILPDDPPKAPKEVAYAPDGRTVLTNGNGSIILWSVQTGKIAHRLAGSPPTIDYGWSMAYAPDGKATATGANGTVRLWNVETGELLHTLIAGAKFIYDLRFAPDGKTLLVSSLDGTATVWDTQTGTHLHTLDSGESNATYYQLHNPAYSSDGKLILTGIQGHTFLWDAQTGDRLRLLCPLALGKPWTWGGYGLCALSFIAAIAFFCRWMRPVGSSRQV